MRAIAICKSTVAISLLLVASWASSSVHPETAKLLPLDGHPSGYFGRSIAIDGDIAVIGASEAAYVFVRDQLGNWTEEAKLVASDGLPMDDFGWSVAIDDDTALVGAVGVRINGSTWGAVYVFTRNGPGNWSEIAKLIASDGHWGDRFGHAVALQEDTALIGAIGANASPWGPGPGVVYVFTRDGDGEWAEETKLSPSDGVEDGLFGYSIVLDGNIALIGAENEDANETGSGSAYVFKRGAAGEWAEQARLVASDGATWDGFGRSVELYGSTALIGAGGDDDNGQASGSVYVFGRDSAGQWTEREKLLAADGSPGDVFGASIAVVGKIAVVGAFGNDDNGSMSGAAYVFTQDYSANWTEQAKLLATDGAQDDRFGSAMAVDVDTAIIGAFTKDDNGSNSGSSYLFDLSPFVSVITASLDFKPDDDKNTINPRSRGRFWMAILSSDTFDALQIDPGSVRLGAGNAAPDKFTACDSNHDGMADLLVRFRTPQVGISCGDTSVNVTAQTYQGVQIVGTDYVRTAGCKKSKPYKGGNKK
jgi:hypothetical protein